MSENSIVTKSNSLIEARYRLTIEEQRIILFLVSLVQPSDEDFKNYTIQVKDFMKLVDIKNKGIYKQFLTLSESLTSKTLTIKKDNSTLVMSWLSSAEYFEKKGKIELSFDPKLKPYLLKLKDNFTTYKLENVIKLKSFYSIRIYELLKQYEKIKERVFTLTQLRNYLCIENEQYPLYANFKQKVLVVAKKELKEKSDIHFEIEEIKVGRKVEKIRFLIYKNSSAQNLATVDTKNKRKINQTSLDHKEKSEKLKELISEPLTQEEILNILDAAQGNLQLIQNRYQIAKNKRQLDNLVGFMIWACKTPDERFKVKETKNITSFQNFEGRKWDYEEIERLQMQALLETQIQK